MRGSRLFDKHCSGDDANVRRTGWAGLAGPAAKIVIPQAVPAACSTQSDLIASLEWASWNGCAVIVKAHDSSVAALGAIVTGALILQVAGTIVNTVVPLRMAIANQPPLLIGLVASSYALGFLLGCFTSPSLVRRIGHIRGFAVFAALQAISSLSFPMMPEAWWGTSRLVMGVSAAGLGICIESWISRQAWHFPAR